MPAYQDPLFQKCIIKQGAQRERNLLVRPQYNRTWPGVNAATKRVWLDYRDYIGRCLVMKMRLITSCCIDRIMGSCTAQQLMRTLCMHMHMHTNADKRMLLPAM